jgi:hypothetical protein
MLEWVTSKVVVSIAALVVLASVSGFMYVQRESWKEDQLSQVSKKISGTINEVSSINAETILFLGFDEGDGIELPDEVGNRPYDIRIERDMVRCQQGELYASSYFLRSVHLFSPDDVDLTNRSNIIDHDRDHYRLETGPTGVIMVQRAPVGIGNELGYETFVYIGGDNET